MRVPLATYRLQFNSSFGFRAAIGIVPYLHDLGISDIYASPIFRARIGSTHGYDVADHNQLNPELGSEDDFRELVTALQSRGMGLLQDTVPNHMAYSAENPLIHDVLERGERSRYFRFFDVDWNHRFAGIDGKILAPFLGDLYGDVLDRGEINLVFGDGGFAVDYHGFRLPLRLKSYPSVLELENRHNRVVPEVIRDMISHIDESPESGCLEENLWKLYNSNVDFKGFLDSRLEDFRGKREDPKSFDPMDKLLSEQTYWLTFGRSLQRRQTTGGSS
jgi:(1->4)-alpha-D-glucan 1-alpha-D-glucosylmutase